MLLLPHADEAGCCTVAKRLARLVAELEGLEAPITVSTGGATLVPAMGSTRIPTADAFLKLPMMQCTAPSRKAETATARHHY